VKLIDSSCWAGYYRPGGDSRIQAAVEAAIESDEAAICGMIRIEILGYIARQAEYDAVSYDFSGIHDIPITHREFDAAVTIGRVLRAKGVSAPVTDLLIAAAAINSQATLLHCDKHFQTKSLSSGSIFHRARNAELKILLSAVCINEQHLVLFFLLY
jgi:predicted nucleic acid-binding protein